jgi:hypothetical protein
MKFYLGANTLAEAQGHRYDFSFAVEDIDKAWPELSRLLCEPPEIPPLMLEEDRNSERHVYDYMELSWKTLYAEDAEIAARIHDFARKVGYE